MLTLNSHEVTFLWWPVLAVIVISISIFNRRKEPKLVEDDDSGIDAFEKNRRKIVKGKNNDHDFSHPALYVMDSILKSSIADAITTVAARRYKHFVECPVHEHRLRDMFTSQAVSVQWLLGSESQTLDESIRLILNHGMKGFMPGTLEGQFLIDIAEKLRSNAEMHGREWLKKPCNTTQIREAMDYVITTWSMGGLNYSIAVKMGNKQPVGVYIE